MIFVPFGSTYRVLARTETGLPHCGGGLVDDGLGQDGVYTLFSFAAVVWL
jgi:hypothetical protein